MSAPSIVARDPQTPQEWQDAIDAAALMIAIHDCYIYGLLTGPKINLERCELLIRRARERGLRPRPPLETLKDGR